MDTTNDAVVVGIGSDGYGAALLYAAAEAGRSHRPLHLVHVLELPPGIADQAGTRDVLERAQATLEEARCSATKLGALSVTTEVLQHGWVLEDLVKDTSTGQLLVLQHRAFTRVRRIFSGSVVHTVASRAHVPVVSVQEGWTPAPDVLPRVTVAVQDPQDAPSLLRIAFEEAQRRAASLVVLHAWWLAAGFDVVVVDDAYRAAWTDRSCDEIGPVLAPLRREFPAVPVTVDVRHAPALAAVLEASERSDLLVVGRRHHRLPSGSHLGPVARGALDHASCPVLVAPEPGPAPVERRPELAGAP